MDRIISQLVPVAEEDEEESGGGGGGGTWDCNDAAMDKDEDDGGRRVAQVRVGFFKDDVDMDDVCVDVAPEPGKVSSLHLC